MSKVSVIIPVYNSSKYLSETLDSLLNQSYQDFEIITVDDGSIDESKNIVDAYIERHPGKIRYIYQENRGIAGARNTGIRNAKGEFIALLDADDKWKPERLEEGVRILESSDAIGLVHANITKISENGEILSTPKREKKYLSGDIFEHLFLRKAEIAALTVLFRKICCEGVGLFDENPVCMGCDDRDLWMRIAQKYRIEYIDKVLAYYRVHSSNYSKNFEKMLAARLYVVGKFFPERSSSLKNCAIAKIYKEAGDEYLRRRDFREARSYYFKSISYGFFSFWPWFNLIKTIFHAKAKHVS